MKRLLFSALCLLVTLGLAAPVVPAQAYPAGPAASGPLAIDTLRPVPLIADPHSTGLGVPARFPPGGLAPQTATFAIDYVAAGSLDYWGYTCQAWPADAQTAFAAATAVWGSLLTSPVTIRIEACWADMGSPSILGSSGSLTGWRDFTGAPRTGTWYQSAMANALSGSDLRAASYCTGLGNPASFCDDMSIVYNSGFAANFFYGTTGSTPAGKYDFMSIVLHEIGHGLGFSGSMYGSSATGLMDWGGSGHSPYPYSYDRYTYGPAGVSLLDTATYPRQSAALYAAVTSNNITFRGENAKAAYAGANVPLYAPATWAQGSSYAHLAETFNTYNSGANALMTYSIGTAEWFHDPGPVGMGVLADVGWAPFAPSGLTATPVSGTQINLGWTDTNLNESGYKIERSPNGTSSWSLINTTAANATSYSDTPLSPSTPYYYRVRAFHAVGESLNATANATTLAGALNAPASLQAVPASPTQINLSWTDTNTSPNETGYLVERSANGTSGWATVTTTAADATGYNNTVLSEGTRYYYRVTAVGPPNSAPSGTANAYTLLNTPSGLTAVGASPTQINLSWTDATTLESGYKVERSATGSDPWTNLTPSPLPLNTQTFGDATVTGENTRLYYRVTALNSATSSAASALANAYTLLNTPSGVAAAGASPTQINLSWTDASGAESGYRVERSATGSAPWTNLTPSPLAANTQAYNDTTVSGENTRQYYRVTALGTNANSAASTPANAYSLLNTPGGLAAVGASPTQINLSWTDASGAETGYKVERSATGSDPWTNLTPSPLPANTQTFGDATVAGENTRLYYRVTALNATTSSAASTPANATTLLNTPTALATTQVPGTSSILIQWTDNSAFETGYEIQTAPSAAGPWTAGTPALPTNLNDTHTQWTPAAGNGTYYFRVRAVGATASSAWSTPSGAVLSNLWIYIPVIKK